MHLATSLVFGAALASAPALSQVVQAIGPVQAADGMLDFDTPLVPWGPIASNAPAFLNAGLASIEATGVWAIAPTIIDPAGNATGHVLAVRNGALAILAAGDVLDRAESLSGFTLRFPVPVEEAGFVLVNEPTYVRYEILLLERGSLIGIQEFTYSSHPQPMYPTEMRRWSGAAPFDELRIRITGGNPSLAIDGLEWRSVGPASGSRYCDPAVPNSSGASAVIEVYCTASDPGRPLHLRANALPLFSFGYFITSRQSGFVAQPGASVGNMCLGGAIGRFVGPGQLRNSTTVGSFGLTVLPGAQPTPSGLVQIQSGDTWCFQAWFRDVAGGSATSNFTDAIEVLFL
jgi:hypothetical protein